MPGWQRPVHPQTRRDHAGSFCFRPAVSGHAPTTAADAMPNAIAAAAP